MEIESKRIDEKHFATRIEANRVDDSIDDHLGLICFCAV